MKHISLIVQDNGRIEVGEDEIKRPKLKNSIEVRTLDAALAVARDLAGEDKEADQAFKRGFAGER